MSSSSKKHDEDKKEQHVPETDMAKEQDNVEPQTQQDQEVALDDLEPSKKTAEDTQKKNATPEEQIDLLNKQLEASNDKYLRLIAEFDNYKRRTGREYERLIELANEQLMGQIIDVLENFERALDPKHQNGDSAQFAEGIKLIYGKLGDILKKNGLEAFGEPGEEFNPEIHDALMKTPHDEIEEDHIAQVFERGYKLKDKIIRHAKVIVSGGTAQESRNDAEAKEECEKNNN